MIKKLLAAAFVAVALSGCATSGSLVTTVMKQECKDGENVVTFLASQQAAYPKYNLFIENVVVGEKVPAVLVALHAPDMGDTVSVITAVFEGKKSDASLVVISKAGCVTGSKFFTRSDLLQAGAVVEN